LQKRHPSKGPYLERRPDMAPVTLEINAQEATFLALLCDMDTETRDLMRTLLRKLAGARIALGAL